MTNYRSALTGVLGVCLGVLGVCLGVWIYIYMDLSCKGRRRTMAQIGYGYFLFLVKGHRDKLFQAAKEHAILSS